MYHPIRQLRMRSQRLFSPAASISTGGMRESHNREIKDITKLADIMQTMDQIYSNWLPNSAYRRVAAPDFEFYDEHFSGDDSPMYVYVPITSA
jgi:hypothetical protein